VDREKIAYATFDGVFFSSEGEASSGVISERDRLIRKPIVERKLDEAETFWCAAPKGTELKMLPPAVFAAIP